MLTSTSTSPGGVRQRTSLFASILLALVAIGCRDNGPTSGTDQQLADELRRTLVDASGGKGLAFFTMPASNDFAAIPQDPRNPITAEKVGLGKLLYHETGLTIRPKAAANAMQGSCASCHHAEAGFQAGVAQGIGTGGWGFGTRGEGRVKDPNCPPDSLDVQPIRSPSAMNVAWQTNILWNGQFGAAGLNLGTQASWTPGTPKEKNSLGYEGLETQAIAGQDVHRMAIERSPIADNAEYQALFAAAFPSHPNATRINDVNAGLAIAAYERTLLANRAPFQRWLKGESGAMTPSQTRGAILFFGKANCVSCHTGPALASMDFHALGMNDMWATGTYGVQPGQPEHKGRGGFTGRSEDLYKFKVPQLYNLDDSHFYGHGGTFTSIRQVVEYKNAGVPENPNVPASQISPLFTPLGLTTSEIGDLVDFLTSGLRDPDLHRYVPTRLPTGFCFPDNDPQAQQDLGCN